MAERILRTDSEIAALYERHWHMLYRLCFAYMKNRADTEDAVQDTFVRFIKAGPRFENETHEKAWLIRTATNVCLNELKHWRRRAEPLEDHYELAGAEQTGTGDVLQAVLALPERYKTAVYLYYYEGYACPEIAGMLKKPQSTVRNYLHEARILLKERLGEDFLEE